VKNLKVSAKLTVSYVTLLALAVLIGAVGILGMYSINAADDALYNENVVAISAMGIIRESLQDQLVQLRNYVLHSEDATAIRDIQSNIASLEKDITEKFGIYEGTITDPSEEKAYYGAKERYMGEFAALKENVRQGSLSGFNTGYNALFNTHAEEIVAHLVESFDTAMSDNDQWAKETVDNNTSLFVTMLTISLIALGAAIAVSVFFAIYISGLISKPLGILSAFMHRAGTSGDITLSQSDAMVMGEMSKVRDEIGQTIRNASSFVSHVTHIAEELKGLSNGDLTIEVEVLSEKDVLGVSLKNVEDNLNNMFGEINSSASQVSSGSKQVADGAQSLAQGATEQAASIEQLSSSIAEIAKQTKQNAEIAERTSKLSGSIKDSAEKGSSQMD
jgi:methyl-accepting chemotaxis protein